MPSRILIFLLLNIFFVKGLVAQSILKNKIQVVGSVNDRSIKTLTKEEFLSFRINKDNKNVGIWLALVTNLNGDNAKVHIINPDFFSNISKVKIRPKYGVHETYARYHDFANGSINYIQKVITGNGELIPLELMIPLKNNMISKDLDIKWVVKNRRYKYANSSTVFTNLLAGAEELIREKLIESSARGAFVDYDKFRTFQRPNSKTKLGKADIDNLGSKNYATISVRELNALIRAKNASQLEIVNKGTLDTSTNLYETYGVLRYINNYSDTATSANSFRALTYNDIPIFSELPLSILPVAGIFVLEPQTELSHVNILAKNRGTLNVSINVDSENWQAQQAVLQKEILGYSTSLINKPVRITHSGGQLSIEEIGELELQNKLRSQRAKQETIVLEKPQLPEQDKWILKPAAQNLGVHLVGAKAANYGKIEKLLGNQHVLPGYAIGFELYLETIKKKGANGIPQHLIKRFLKAKDTLSNFQISARLSEIRNAIYAIPYEFIPRRGLDSLSVIDELEALLSLDESVMGKAYFEFEPGGTKTEDTVRSVTPSNIRKDLFKNFSYRNVGKLRFRSSTNCEDLPKFNGAGLYLSQGCKVEQYGKRYIDQRLVWEKLKKVLASLWLDKAYYERAYFRVDHTNAAMAIQINPAFSNYWLGMPSLEEWANGVAVYQENKGVPSYNISSQIGVAAVTNPVDGELSESFILRSNQVNVKQLSRVAGKTNYIFVQPDGELVHSLSSEGQILSELKWSLQTIFEALVLQNSNPEYSNPDNYAIDIEYKIMWNPMTKIKKLFIKQARPLRLK